jgi:uncharacterized protein
MGSLHSTPEGDTPGVVRCVMGEFGCELLRIRGGVGGIPTATESLQVTLVGGRELMAFRLVWAPGASPTPSEPHAAILVGVSDETSIQVNFGKAMPLFPLDSVALLPQQVLPLHIFEPRYRQMVTQALDASGQLALAVFQGSQWKQNYHGRPALRPAVCVGQIVEHEKLPDGRYNILVQGVCRATIIEESEPDDERLFRTAFLKPMGLEHGDAEFQTDVRARLIQMLSEGSLTKLASADQILEYLRNENIPTHALLELIAFSFVSDAEKRYSLLAEAEADERARIILHELDELARVVRLALLQHAEEWPKGCSWN